MQIEGFSSYEFYEDGSVYSYKSKRYLIPTFDLYGYLKISCIDESGKRKTNGLHNWICRAFHGDPPYGYEACHIDDNKTNCRADNLIWDSHKNNINYGSRALAHCKQIAQYSLNGDFIRSYPSAKVASKENKISYDGILDTANGKQKTSGGFVWRYQ